MFAFLFLVHASFFKALYYGKETHTYALRRQFS